MHCITVVCCNSLWDRPIGISPRTAACERNKMPQSGPPLELFNTNTHKLRRVVMRVGAVVHECMSAMVLTAMENVSDFSQDLGKQCGTGWQ